MGRGRALIFWLTMRASVGVISGRMARSRPPRSVREKSSEAISWPLFSVKSLRCSKMGPSYSTKALRREALRQPSVIQLRTAISLG